MGRERRREKSREAGQGRGDGEEGGAGGGRGKERETQAPECGKEYPSGASGQKGQAFGQEGL